MDFAPYFDSAAGAIKAKLDDRLTGRRLMAYHMALLGKDIFAGERPVVWVNVTTPFEIINCFPVASIYSEFIGAVLSGAGMAGPFLEKAEAEGYPTDLCSYHRALLGANFAGILPKPLATVSSTLPCDGGVKSISELATRANAPNFIVQVPERLEPGAVDYLAGRFEELTGFLAEVTGHPFDMDKLKQNIENSNKAAVILDKVYGFGEIVPAPFTHKDMKNFQVIMLPLVGTDVGVQIAQTFFDEFSKKVDQGLGGIPDEKIRLMWIQNRIQFPNKLLDHIAESHGANIVWDELNEIYWEPIDPDNPFEGLALRLIDSPLGGDLKKRTDTLVKRSKQYKVDGAIHPSHWGCRQSLSSRQLFADAFDQAGIPMMSLDVDCVDVRSFAEGQLLTRLEAFCEMIR